MVLKLNLLVLNMQLKVSTVPFQLREAQPLLSLSLILNLLFEFVVTLLQKKNT